MASSDTLELGSFGHHRPAGKPAGHTDSREPTPHHGNHPEAAEAARARIADLPETYPLEDHHAVPSVPSHELVTDRERLRQTLAEPAQAPAAGAAKRPLLPSTIQPVLTAIGIFLLILIVFKSPVLLSQLGYNLGKPAATPSAAPAAAIIPADPTITIPKINVSAPVVYQPSSEEATFEKALESGVAHYPSTALPGQVGNVALFGHSSNDWWQPGNFKFVFVLLDKLVPGDQIMIDYQSKRYTYEVTGSKVVEPTAVEVLNPTPTATLSLITCSPPGTSWKRLVVTAKQIDPSPAAAAAAATPAPAAGNQALSSGSPSLFDQVGRIWNSITGFFTGNKPAATPTPVPAAGSLPAAQ